MKKFWKLMVTLGLITALAMVIFPVPALAIQNGGPDGNNHPYVCLVVFYDITFKPLWRTTGELLSPTVVLTAGHGTIGTAYASVWFLSTIPASAPGGYPYYGGTGSYTGLPYTNPDYKDVPTPGLPGFDYHDVGVVVLNSPVSTNVVGAYAQLPAAGLVDTLSMKSPVDLVGYGVNSQIRGGGLTPANSWFWERQRQYAPANLVQSKDVLSTEFLKVTANPGQDKGGTTFGDSGGPILQADTSTILGINSFVNNYNCSGVTYAQRIDIPDILEWINGFMD